MNENSSIPALIAYIPVVGWLYVYLLQRKNPLAVFHLRQSVGLFLFLVGIFVGWAVIAYVRALQRAHHASIDDVPLEHRGDLK